MKTKIYFFALTVMSAFGLQAQTIMNIHQSNGTVLQIPLNTIDSITYTIPNPGNFATLTTSAASSIAETTAVSGGNITNDGGSLVTQRGICYGTSPSPTTANMTIISGSGTGSFTSNLTGLMANSIYHVRAYAINSAGTVYGNNISFTTTSSGGGIFNPNLTYGSITDIDGNNYATIVIGTQEWMAENLHTSKYANGDPIPNVTDVTQWSNLTTGAWSYFSEGSQYENPYGKLYNWHTVNDTRNVCPLGWHVPSDAEWTVLSDYLGGESVAGGKMKSTGTQYWLPNVGATNESGFSGLPGGYSDGFGNFGGIFGGGFWWSSSEFDNYYVKYHGLFSDVGAVYDAQETKNSGMSVRCLRD